MNENKHEDHWREIENLENPVIGNDTHPFTEWNYKE